MGMRKLVGCLRALERYCIVFDFGGLRLLPQRRQA